MNAKLSLKELQLVVVKVILIASSFLFFIIALNDYLLGYTEIALIKIPIIVINICALYKLKISGYKQKYSHFVLIPILIFFVINFIHNQGTDGPTIIGSLGTFAVYQIILNKRLRLIYAIITVTLIIVLLYLGINKENLIIAEYSNPYERFIDFAITYVFMAAYIYVVVGMVLNNYKKQNLELSLAEKKLLENIKLLEAEKKQKGDLLTILAHDVRSPICNISQMIEMYQDNLLSKTELSELFNKVQFRVNDLRSTIDNILDQVKYENNANNTNRVYINPVEATQNLINTLNYLFHLKKQKVSLHYSENIKSFLQFGKNANEVIIILKNLLDNSSKYSPEGSNIKINITEDKNCLQWDIFDEGHGISEELQKKLFNTKVKSENGLGLGLFLCNSIAQSIEAQLKYLNDDKGNHFQLILNQKF